MKVSLVGGHPAILMGLRGLLGAVGSIEVAGETDDADEALSFVLETRPDMVIIVDSLLKGCSDGAEACRKLKSISEPPLVLIYTEHNSGEDLARCALAGVDGYFHTDLDPEKIVEVVERVYVGKAVWEVGAVSNGTRNTASRIIQSTPLTPREKEVLRLVLGHRSNAEIAQELFVGVRTVKAHVSSILRKSGAKNRSGLREHFRA